MIKNRVEEQKALVVHMATEHMNATVSEIAKLFELKKQLSTLTLPKHKYLFTGPKYTIPKNILTQYKKLINRQTRHTIRMCAYKCSDIVGDLDLQLETKKGKRMAMN